MNPASYPSAASRYFRYRGCGPIQLIAMTPILFSGLKALRDSRAVNMFIGIRRVSISLIVFDHCAPLFPGDPDSILYANAALGSTLGHHVLLSRSIAQQMINSRRAVVATTTSARRGPTPRMVCKRCTRSSRFANISSLASTWPINA